MAVIKTRALNMAALILVTSLLCLAFSVTALAAANVNATAVFAGQPLEEVLKRYSDHGIRLLYSSNYVLPSMLIRKQPVSTEPLQQLSELLQPFGLQLKQVGDSYLVVKPASKVVADGQHSIVIVVRHPETIASLQALQLSAQPNIKQLLKHGEGLYEYFPPQPGEYAVSAELPGYLPIKSRLQFSGSSSSLLMLDLKTAPRGIEEINVSASRYILFSGSEYVIDQKSIEVTPLLARDPVRAAQRIQGTAADGMSARSHYRGGVTNESSIYLNGLKLLEPYHIRDYHSIFSSIGAQMVSSIQVYTGGFPVEYGDDMSAVMLLQSKAPDKPMHTELGLSLFYASLLNTGHSENQTYDWLISARRSNLEYVLNPEYGEPEYFDVFTTLGFNPNDHSRLTLNVLYTRDEVNLIIESDPEELEQSLSDTNNKSVWLTLENDWGARLSASTTLAYTDFSNQRIAAVSDPEELVSRLQDTRNVQKLNLTYNMRFASDFGHVFKWGLDFSRQKANYRYAGTAAYFDLWSEFPGIQNPVAYQIETHPKGNSYAAYLSDRIALTDSLSLELGLRWDKQTYTETSRSSQLSPRASLLYDFDHSGELRFTAGRYYQAQQIQEMQVEDNINHFFPVQYADQLIVGYQWSAFEDYRFRVESYFKKYHQLAPRFENLYDPLQLAPEFQADRVMLDPESAEAKGLEMSVEYASGEAFSWWASYTWAKVTDSINGVNQRRSWDQPHAFQAGMAWQKGPWDVGVAVRVHTGWPTTALELVYDPVSGDPQPVPGPRNAQRLGAFASFDFRVSRQFDIGRGELSGFVEVTNATNRSNPCCIDYGLDEDENGQVVIESDTEHWLPIIPSIGVLWRF